ncbi:type II secretion system minor pseudopilin GspH [Shewanella sp. 202IG2-18]|uniref:type II secretion system minor pseudopilin GspH n=1 Tax=Parashewanella hymeniacidonis TaxID=2807618 RepID=UPI001960924B|nr:type II secretion system minor pseudopilin GspH [Parashewanella hymeniacidonis]MBM7071110.1 type II secretion system minor pseudopilin GspH [Parashewanella hymeniacidonis]
MKLRQPRGFTLLEMMIVVVLMGLMAVSVIPSIGSAGPEQKLEGQAKKFIALTELVMDETVLSGQFVGIVVDPDGYHFVMYKDQKWQPMTSDRLVTEHKMDEGISIEVVVDGLPLTQSDEENESWFDDDDPFAASDDKFDDEKKKFPEPQIMIFPSGELTPFELHFVTKNDDGNEVDKLVTGSALGQLTLGRPDETKKR